MAIQKGVTVLPDGAISNYAPSGASSIVRIGPTGVWMVPEYNTNPVPDKIVRGVGAVPAQVYKTGDPIFAGASERWSDDPHLDTYVSDFRPSNTFFSFQTGPDGHYVVGGMTDEPNKYRHAVLVYDNQVVIARSNDPIDLDGNGRFDDDAYIRSFVRLGLSGGFFNPLAFTNDNAVLVVVTVRDGASALCQQTRMSEGNTALVRISLPLGACCNGTVCSSGPAAGCTGMYKGDGTTCGPAGNPTTCCPANINGVGGVTVQDIFDFLAFYFSNNPRADFNGVNGISVQDIFDFLAAYFAGC